MAPSTEWKPVAVAQIETPADEPEGVIEALVSITGIVDNVGDLIEPGAYKDTLKKRIPKGVWSHSLVDPVAKALDAKELMPGDPALPATLPDGTPWPKQAGALYIKALFNMKGERGKQAYHDVVFFGDEAQWSVGYKVPKGKATVKSGIRHIHAMDLWEFSPVLFGAMPHARTLTSVKAAQEQWIATKAALFGECFDGDGTCCLSCGSHVETKADAPIDDARRWIVDFGDEIEGIPAVVGTFASKAAAERWASQAEVPDGYEVKAVAADGSEEEPSADEAEWARLMEEVEASNISDEEAFGDVEFTPEQRSELIALGQAEGVTDEAIVSRMAHMLADNAPAHVLAAGVAFRGTAGGPNVDDPDGGGSGGSMDPRVTGAQGGRAYRPSKDAKKADEDLDDALDDLHLALFAKSDWDPKVHPRGRDGKFVERGGAVRSLGRAARRAVGNAPRGFRRSDVKDRFRSVLDRAREREDLLAVAEGRSPLSHLAKFYATLYAALSVKTDERVDFIITDLDVDLKALRDLVIAETKDSGLSSTLVERFTENIDYVIDAIVGTKAIDVDPTYVDLLADIDIDLKVEAMTAEDVLDEMAALDAKTLDALCDAVDDGTYEIKVDEANPAGEVQARHLIRWFERGEGAAKIRWGTKGDFMRCVRIASKHMTPEQAKGFCNKRHVGATGSTPGQGPHAGKALDDEMEAKFDAWLTDEEYGPPIDLDEGKADPLDTLDIEIDTETKDTCLYCNVDLDIKGLCSECGTTWDAKGLGRIFKEALHFRDRNGKFAPKAGGDGDTPRPRRLRGKAKPAVDDTPAPTGVKKATGTDAEKADWSKTLDLLTEMASDRTSLLHHMYDREMVRRANANAVAVNFGGPSGSMSGNLGDPAAFSAGLGALRAAAGAGVVVDVNLDRGIVSIGDQEIALDDVSALDALLRRLSASGSKSTPTDDLETKIIDPPADVVRLTGDDVAAMQAERDALTVDVT